MTGRSGTPGWNMWAVFMNGPRPMGISAGASSHGRISGTLRTPAPAWEIKPAERKWPGSAAIRSMPGNTIPLRNWRTYTGIPWKAMTTCISRKRIPMPGRYSLSFMMISSMDCWLKARKHFPAFPWRYGWMWILWNTGTGRWRDSCIHLPSHAGMQPIQAPCTACQWAF